MILHLHVALYFMRRRCLIEFANIFAILIYLLIDLMYFNTLLLLIFFIPMVLLLLRNKTSNILIFKLKIFIITQAKNLIRMIMLYISIKANAAI
jgi:hypothetical protein